MIMDGDLSSILWCILAHSLESVIIETNLSDLDLDAYSVI